MNEKIDSGLKDKLEVALSDGLSDDCLKAVKKATEQILYDIESDIQYRMKDALVPDLVSWVSEMAQKAVEQILEGNEDQMRRYLSCEKQAYWNGRSDAPNGQNITNRKDYEWHPIIHGSLFIQGAVALRAKIVNTHRELLVNERILDLEDQVKSLVAQFNKATKEKEAMWERLRAVEPNY